MYYACTSVYDSSKLEQQHNTCPRKPFKVAVQPKKYVCAALLVYLAGKWVSNKSSNTTLVSIIVCWYKQPWNKVFGSTMVNYMSSLGALCTN